MDAKFKPNAALGSCQFGATECSGNSQQEIDNATISVTSYVISFYLSEVHHCIDYIDKRFRQHPLCRGGNNGFKNELNRLVAYAAKRRVQEEQLAGEAKERVRIMARFIHEDLANTYMKMYATTSNFLSFHGMREPALFASVAVAQMVCNWAVANIEKLCDDAMRHKPQYTVVRAMAPKQTEKLIIALEDKIAKLLDADKVTCNMNDIPGLPIMLTAFTNTLQDINQLESYCAEGLERTEGAAWLKENAESTYYLLHPDQDPAYLAEKARREAEYELAMAEKAQQDAIKAKRQTESEKQYNTAEGLSEMLGKKYKIKK